MNIGAVRSCAATRTRRIRLPSCPPPASKVIDPQTSVIVFQSVDARGHVVGQVPTQAPVRRRTYGQAQTGQAQTALALVQGEDITPALLGAAENVDITT